jgi:uncharacterized membrane protein YbhN (UPF0104 family)
MQKLVAIINVIAWSGFWAFGYLALTGEAHEEAHIVTAAILAAIGGGAGMLAWFWLVRHSEETGYAKRPKRAQKRDENTTGEVN